jgi:putative type II/III system pilus formation protein
MTITKTRSMRAVGCALAIAGGLFASPASAADLLIEINQSKLHQLARAASTIVVGNPAIADVSVGNANTLIVFGRSYGKTNLIALDAAGQQIANLDLNVIAVRDSALTVNRGTGQYSYNCTPNCVRVLNPADEGEATSALLATTQAVSGFGDQAASNAGE